MRLAVYGVPFPEGMAMTNRLRMYFKALSNKSLSITAYSVGNHAEMGTIEGVGYEIIARKNLIQKHFDLYYLYAFVHAFNVWRIAPSYDIILVNRFGWVTLALICMVGKLRGCKIILELNENPASPGGSRMFPKWLRIIIRWVTLNLPFRLLDGFICISIPLGELAEKFKKPSAKTVIIPILCDTNQSSISGSDDLPPMTEPYIFHAGFFDQQKDGIYFVFEAFALACKSTDVHIRFILTVRSAQQKVLNRIDRILKEHDIEDRVVWLGYVPPETIDMYRANASMGILNRPSNWQNHYNFPTKLGELLADGIPVIASRTGEMNRYLIDGETAFLVDPNNVDQIADKIIFILEHPDAAKTVGKNGLGLAQRKFDYHIYSDILFKFLQEVNTNC